MLWTEHIFIAFAVVRSSLFAVHCAQKIPPFLFFWGKTAYEPGYGQYSFHRPYPTVRGFAPSGGYISVPIYHFHRLFLQPHQTFNFPTRRYTTLSNTVDVLHYSPIIQDFERMVFERIQLNQWNFLYLLPTWHPGGLLRWKTNHLPMPTPLFRAAFQVSTPCVSFL